jgi:glycolate oxidase
MALEKEVYKTLEAVVGPENISEEPAVVDSYAFQWLGELIPVSQGGRFVVRPEAVLLPGSTEEVQAIVKACNRYKIKFKALSTGWGVWAGPGTEGVVQLDLRRMNRIIEINEKNMYAVVEPYVIGARLQAELMKRNLNCQIISAGSNVSALPLTALGGDGFSSVSTGMHSRNVLGVEWVLPNGEILKLGSLGSGAGWFCGDGPGPSLRGITRGVDAAAGGMGVFTKAATKIYHWPGPSDFKIEGMSPNYTIRSSPPMRCHYLLFASWEKLAEAGIKVAESEIAYGLAILSKLVIAAEIASCNEEGAGLFTELQALSDNRPGFLVILQAKFAKESDYQEKVLRQILSETGGELVTLLEKKDISDRLAWRLTRLNGPRRYFRFTGGGFAHRGTLTNWNRLPGICGGEGRHIIKKYTQQGLLLDGGGDIGFATSIEYGHLGVAGINAFYDHTDSESRQAILKMILEMSRMTLETYKYCAAADNAEEHNVLGPLQNNYHIWQRKIKKAFDSNNTSDPSNYIKA